MSSIDELFERLRQEQRKAFMPFITAGDPDLEFTREVVRELATQGSSLCEIGIPYSDPLADGPTIQASYTRALASKLKLSHILEHCQGWVPSLEIPAIMMISYSIVHRFGADRYVRESQAAGFGGAIVPDLPIEESAKLAETCRQADFSLVQLVTPTTPRERALRIAETSSGFLYFVSVAGITGERRSLPPDLADSVAWLRERTPLPVCVGFGISTPEHIRMLAPVCDGLIVGSAFVRRIAEVESTSREAVLREIGQAAAELVAALPQSSA